MIEIQKTGSYFNIDKDGYLINPASLDKVQDEWKLLVQAVIQLYKREFKDSLVSLYLRGSVSKGEAVAGISDIDTWAFVDMDVAKVEDKI